MIALVGELQRSLIGVWRLLRGDDDFPTYFDVSAAGFWRSFAAALFALPIFVFILAAQMHALGELGVPAEETTRFGFAYGALTYAALLPGPYPMVGASGALFGLAGAWQYWVQADAPRRRRAWITLRAALGLIGLNLLLLWYLDGRMAWQTHLGGFVAGWVTAGVLHRSKS